MGGNVLMKKRSRRERKEDFKKAYYAELQKQGIMDEKKEPEKKLEDMTKKELIEFAKSKELDVNEKMTKAEIIELIGE
jgi:hypothetical protein